MSYRNPQQYGIVEDMTAGVKAFQQGFGQVAGAIEKVKQDREKEEIRRDESNANWILTTEQDLAKYQYLSDGYQDLMRDMVTKDVGSEFFDKKSKAKQAMLLRKLQQNAEFGNDFFQLVDKVKKGEIELDNPEMMKYIDSVENNPKYALDKDNDPTLNGVKLSVIMAEMKKNEPVVGSEAEYSQTYSNARKRIEEAIASESKTLGGKLSQDRINQIINNNINTELISHPSAHWTYKNKIQGKGKYGKITDTNYIGGGIATENLEAFNKERDDALKEYYRDLLVPSIISKGISKTEELGIEYRKKQIEEIGKEDQEAENALKTARSSMQNILLKNDTTKGMRVPPNRSINLVLRDFNNKIVNKNYQIVPGPEDGTYALEYVGKGLTATAIEEGKDKEDITALVKQLQRGNNSPLIDRLMAKVYGESPNDLRKYKATQSFK
tara:strand:+ start:434 stop:1750 length:1317 start_codon:yes stop_codon:yes gene_type:complete